MIRNDGKSREDMLDWLVEQNGGRLNPMWVEWLMGWPLGWTDLKPLEMDKFQQWQQQFLSTLQNDRITNIDLLDGQKNQRFCEGAVPEVQKRPQLHLDLS